MGGAKGGLGAGAGCCLADDGGLSWKDWVTAAALLATAA